MTATLEANTMITHAMARELGFCNEKMRPWFEAHGVAWADFRVNGVSVAWALAQDDAQATKLAHYALQKIQAKR